MPDFITELVYEQSTLSAILFSLLSGVSLATIIRIFYITKKGAGRTIFKTILIVVSFAVLIFSSITGTSAIFSSDSIFLSLLLSTVCTFALPFIVWVRCHKKSRKEALFRLQANPLITEIVSSAKETNATAIYCCKDGVRIIHSTKPPQVNISNPGLQTCKSLQEFKNTDASFSKINHFLARAEHCIDFIFSDYNYPPLTELLLFDIADTIAAMLNHYTVKQHRHYIQFTEKGQYSSSGVYTAYSVGGITKITDGTTKSRDKRHSKAINYYAAIIHTDFLPQEEAALVSKNTMNEW